MPEPVDGAPDDAPWYAQARGGDAHLALQRDGGVLGAARDPHGHLEGARAIVGGNELHLWDTRKGRQRLGRVVGGVKKSIGR